MSTTLFYGDRSREVATVKAAPVNVKCTTSEDGMFNVMECRIHVLSSQHDDSNFRVRFLVLDGQTGKPLEPECSAWSGLIRVVSKPEQVPNAAGGGGGVLADAADDASVMKPQKIRGAYVEQLERIRDAEALHVTILRELVQQKEEELRAAGREHEILRDEDIFPPNYVARHEPAAAPSGKAATAKGRKRVVKKKRGRDDYDEDDDSDVEEDTGKTKRGKKDDQEGSRNKDARADALDTAFFRFVAAFNDLDAAGRAEQLRKALRSLNQKQGRMWKQFLEDALVAEQATPAARDSAPVDYCTCVGCPYRASMMNFDANPDIGGMGLFFE